MSEIIYQQVAWMQPVKDQTSEKEFYTLGPVEGMENTLAVTPAGGKGETLFYCQTHSIAYGLHDTCHECRTQVRDIHPQANSETTLELNSDPLQVGVTDCNGL